MRIVRKIFIYLMLAGITSGFSSCLTFLQLRMNGDTGKAVNVIVTEENKDIQLTINDKQLDRKLIYDGSQNASPYYVYRYHLPKAYKVVNVQYTRAGVTYTRTVERERRKGLFWISGLWFIVDACTGSWFKWADVVI